MRDWVLELEKRERCTVHDFEFLLGRRITGRKEYDEIKELVPVEYAALSKKEFFRQFPAMKAYKKPKE